MHYEENLTNKPLTTLLGGKPDETRYAETNVYETPFHHLKPQLGVTIKEISGKPDASQVSFSSVK